MIISGGSLEFWLSCVAIVVSVFALFDSRAATDAAKESATAAVAQLQIEQAPAFNLACNGGADLAAEQELVLGDVNPYHVSAPVVDADPHDSPHAFFHCRISNAGRVAVLSVIFNVDVCYNAKYSIPQVPTPYTTIFDAIPSSGAASVEIANLGKNSVAIFPQTVIRYKSADGHEAAYDTSKGRKELTFLSTRDNRVAAKARDFRDAEDCINAQFVKDGLRPDFNPDTKPIMLGR